MLPYFDEPRSTKDLEALFIILHEARITMANEELTDEQVLALEKEVETELERLVVMAQNSGNAKSLSHGTRILRGRVGPIPKPSLLDFMTAEVVWLREALKSITVRRRKRQPLVFTCFPHDPSSMANQSAYWGFERDVSQVRKSV